MAIKITAVSRTHKGKGVTVTVENLGLTRDFVVRKTGGEKYGKIGLWEFPADLYARLRGIDDGFPIAISIHKPTTKVEPHTPEQVARTGCQLVDMANF